MTQPSDGYMLGRGLGPSLRLLTQHWLWKDQFGWNLCPEAGRIQQTEPGKRLNIADLATGNAIWLIEEGSCHPSDSYSGFDINKGQFPPDETLPNNVTLHTLDATGTVPEEHVGVFDIVHIRLLVPAIRANDPRAILRNALRMLKPGGFLQWSEIIPQSITLGHPEHISAAQKIISAALAKMGSPDDHQENWIRQLPRIFEECGLQEIKVFKMGEPKKEMWRYWYVPRAKARLIPFFDLSDCLCAIDAHAQGQ